MSSKKIFSTDPSQNFIERYDHPLDPLFHPDTVAIIGAKDDPSTVGRTLMVNLLSPSFKGRLYPINPKREKVFDQQAYPTISDVPEKIDLAIIATPAHTVPKIIAECVEVGVRSVIVISAGFKELGAEGKKIEDEITALARKGKMPLIGPNCLGVMNPINGLNATFARGMAIPGNLAFISQSGAMCTAVLDWSLKNKVGFSAFISVGSMADVGWGTLIDYLGSDPHTHSLLLYMETVGDVRSFMTAAREVALEKPIILIKAGKTEAAALAAASHTGSLAGRDDVLNAALERTGVLRVDTIGELFNMASILAKQPRPKGPNLTIVTNAGGPGVLATDAAIFNHAELTSLSPQTVDELNQVLPKAWSHSNPVDILGDATAERYANSMAIVMKDPASHGVLAILTPQDMTDATAAAQKVKEIAQNSQKPILASWMGGEAVEAGAEILSHANIPVFEYPDEAAASFAAMWRYSQNLETLYETPMTHPVIAEEKEEMLFEGEPLHTKQLIEKAREEGKTLLDEYESKLVLSDFHIPSVKTERARSREEAIKIADALGFPVVLKLFSHTITHKTDVGGVKLNLHTAADVAAAFEEIRRSVTEKVGGEHFDGVTVQQMITVDGYELILGSTTDPQFGPVLLFGAGGQLVEVFKDRALAIPPLNSNLARKLMQKTKIYEALKGVRGKKSIDLKKLEEILMNFSQLIIENPRIKECDINPLIVSGDTLMALDARIILHEWAIPDEELPPLAIRPYPLHYVMQTQLKNGVSVTLRPILPEDEPLVVQFHRELSENSVRQRYFDFMSLDDRVAHERLVRICFNDYDREWAIIASIGEGRKRQIIGIGRLMRIPGIARAQFKLIIADAFHYQSLGTQLLKHLLLIAAKEKIEFVDGYILSENREMQRICEKLGFMIHSEKNSNMVHAEWMCREVP